MHPTITVEQISSLFDEYNAAYFDGVLKRPKFKTIKSKNLYGSYNSLKNELKISHSVAWDAENLKSVLLHEMLHLYIRKVLKDHGRTHGRVFHKYAKALSNKSGVFVLYPPKPMLFSDGTKNAGDLKYRILRSIGFLNY